MAKNIVESNLIDSNIRHLPEIDSLTINDDIFQFILEKSFSEDVSLLQNWLKSIKEINYKFGTKEWANENFNTHYACKHGCWYCYAWCEAYQRHRPYCDDWGKKMEKRKYWNKGWKKREDGYTIMYPTTHDVVPEIMDDCFTAIRNMLEANMNVLFVTKPHFKVIKNLTERFSEYKVGQPKITLRFSIGTNDNDILTFWEPKTPRYEERFNSLKYAYQKGFCTSVSMEPYFPPKSDSNQNDLEEFIKLVYELLSYVKGTLWIGMMNHIPVNVQRGKKLTELQKLMIKNLNSFYDIEYIKRLVLRLYNEKKIKWKESIKKKVIEYIHSY